MPFSFQKLEIPDVILITPEIFQDQRGYFLETYKESEFKQNGITENFVQDNISHSTKGILRGLHYQIHPEAQGKLVMVLKGQIYDVAVDIREGSPFFGRWIGITLSGEKRQMLYIPPGFAHGFCVLSEETDFVYKCTKEYSPATERGIIWNDSTINIQWPIKDPHLSSRDETLPPLTEADLLQFK